jgi:hypothetical protein
LLASFVTVYKSNQNNRPDYFVSSLLWPLLMDHWSSFFILRVFIFVINLSRYEDAQNYLVFFFLNVLLKPSFILYLMQNMVMFLFVSKL